MRILLFTNLHPTPWHPGRAVFNANLVAGLRAAGHEVRVVVPVDWREQRGSPRAAVPEASFLPWFHPPLVRRDLWHHWMWLSLGGALRREARTFDPDIVIGGWVHPDGAVALRLARHLGCPGVVLAGGSDLLRLTRSPRRRAEIVRVLRSADAILTHGRHLREAALELEAPADRTVAFYRGVDHRRFTPGPALTARLRLGLSPDARLLLSVGNLVEVKGHDVLVEALGHEALRGLDWQWNHLGEGPARSSLLRQAEALGIADRIRLFGRVAHDALPDWYRAADLQVLPSRSEGVPNVLMEGLACGLPFIASAVGGVPEIAESASWCVPPEDPEALALAIRAALTDPPAVTRAAPSCEEGLTTVMATLNDALARAA